jgi:histidinol-phosphatase (PHP family)
MYDYHMHSNHSSDGRDSINSLCIAAVKKGLKEIAISDHFEPTAGNEHYPFYDPEKYFGEIAEANHLLKGIINVRSAVELGQPHNFPEYSEKLIKNYSYDYVLASAHKMADNNDFGDLFYSPENLSDQCIKYLDELEELAKWNKFDCIGHLDLVKRYAANFNLNPRLMDYNERLEVILKIVIKNGKGIEVNTSGLRQASRECLPDLDILSFYRELGGEIVTLGSDAHNSADVGKGIADAVELLKEAGFEYLALFEKGKPSMIRMSSSPSAYCLGKSSA